MDQNTKEKSKAAQTQARQRYAEFSTAKAIRTGQLRNRTAAARGNDTTKEPAVSNNKRTARGGASCDNETPAEPKATNQHANREKSKRRTLCSSSEEDDSTYQANPDTKKRRRLVDSSDEDYSSDDDSEGKCITATGQAKVRRNEVIELHADSSSDGSGVSTNPKTNKRRRVVNSAEEDDCTNDDLGGKYITAKVQRREVIELTADLSNDETGLSTQQLQTHCLREYTAHVRNNRIRVCALGTFQGNKENTTNGCGVISFLVIVAHLSSDGAVTDAEVCKAIDSSGPMLVEIRRSLGFNIETAYLEASAISEHFTNCNLLLHAQFEDVVGGNILNPNHLNTLLETISVGREGNAPWNRKAGATLLFCAHFISIVKVPVSPNQISYDLVDSLPGLRIRGKSFATRTHCADVDSLRVLLRQYTTNKFTAEDCEYMDSELFAYSAEWSDTDDRRVFQAYVWADN